MTWFDILVIALLIISTLLACLRGAIREVSTLLCVVTAAGMSYRLAQPLGAVTGLDSRGAIAVILLGLVIFVLLFVLWTIFVDGLLLRYVGKSPGLVDRLLGGFFGFVRGYLLIGVMFLALTYYAILDPATPDAGPIAATGGVTAPLARSAGDILARFGISPNSRSALPPDPLSEPQSDPPAGSAPDTDHKPADAPPKASLSELNRHTQRRPSFRVRSRAFIIVAADLMTQVRAALLDSAARSTYDARPAYDAKTAYDARNNGLARMLGRPARPDLTKPDLIRPISQKVS